MKEQRTALKPGQILAETYRVDSPLDSGGNAEIYLATRLQDGLPVAIKALRIDVEQNDPAAPDRFVREAALAAHLRHPNLVRIFDFGRSRETVLYMVMERLVGRTLSSILYGAPLEPTRVLHILCQLLDALVVAHGQGAVHRDLKPSNVFLCPVQASQPGDPEDWVKILDFGFAKGLSTKLGKEMRRTLTLDGSIVCTPGYVAPELLSGKGRLTPLVDLYAVGIMGHEMLTGEPAFPGEGIERATLQLARDPPEPPGFISQSPMYQTIRHLMTRDPAARTQSASLALRELQSLLGKRGRLWM